MNNPRPAPAGCRGFTLMEAVLVIVITGILGAVVAVFIRAPVEGYIDTVRRADMTDAADGALRRIARDVRTALPNSLRQAGTLSDQCFEFLPTVGGGRYRVARPGDILDFSTADTSFDVLGDPPAPNSNLPGFAASTYHAVIYNLGIPGANAYDAVDHNRATINASSTVTNIVLTAGNKFPLESPFKRFDVISDYSVAYSCSGGSLIRSTQAISATPLTACPSTGTVLAGNVSLCSFSYTPAVSQRNGLLTMTLGLTQSGESIRLYHEIHVNNVP